MNVLVTAGPTREYLDPVRFITNASSGTMGFAVAREAGSVGHRVTLLAGPVALEPPPGVEVVPFVTVDDLRRSLEGRFYACDALIMSAAVGDFRPTHTSPTKLRRAAGPITLQLTPTDDILAGLAARRRAGQILIGFAVEDVEPERSARNELTAKGVDYVVVNQPEAMGAAASWAAILGRAGVALPWADRSKDDLARHIVALLDKDQKQSPELL